MPATALRPILAPTEVKAVLDASRGDAATHAGVALLTLVGLRAAEIEDVWAEDYTVRQGTGRLRVGTLQHQRAIEIAPAAVLALDGYLAARAADRLDDHLLPELRVTRLVQRTRRTAQAAGVTAGVHDLRRAAMNAVLSSGLPLAYLAAYFGAAETTPVALPAGYDAEVAAVLEHAFA